MPKFDKSGCLQAALAMLGLLVFVFILERCMGLPLTSSEVAMLTQVADPNTQTEIAAVLTPVPPTPVPPTPELAPPPKQNSSSSMDVPPNPCLPAPVLFDPPQDKTVAAKNTILRWRSDYALKAGEAFSVLVWPESGEKASIGTTRDMTFPIDLLKWKYAGAYGKYSWSIAIANAGGIVLSCQGEPFSFVFAESQPPSAPAPAPPPARR